MNEPAVPHTVAEAYLAHLKRRGIDYLFANGGTDFAPIVEAYARARESRLAFPQPIAVPHENAAVCMALGYTMVTGRVQAVMVHVSVGTANAVLGLMNAMRDRVPLLMTAGRTPLFEECRFGSRASYIHIESVMSFAVEHIHSLPGVIKTVTCMVIPTQGDSADEENRPSS